MSIHDLSFRMATSFSDGVGLHVVIVLPTDPDLLSLSILLDLLHAANRAEGQSRFTCETVTPREAMRIGHRSTERHLLLVADGTDATAQVALPSALASLWRAGSRVGGWGSGCLALAEAGLLTGRRFALADNHRFRLTERWPGLWPVEQTFCDDERVLTSVGKAVLSDMVLHLIGQICGRKALLAAMDSCLIRRSPWEGQGGRCAAATAGRSENIDPRIAAVDRWIDHNIAHDVTPRDLARAGGLSIRQLERIFVRNLDRTPAEHLAHKRLDLAMRLLRETDLGVREIARSSGHPSTTTFARKFKRRFGLSPFSKEWWPEIQDEVTERFNIGPCRPG